MATYTFTSFNLSDITLTGSSTGTLQVNPDWDASADAYQFEVTDSDLNFGGDLNNDEVGDDNTQSMIVRDETGFVVDSGQAYLETAYVITDEFGATINIYRVEIDGWAHGYIADGQLQPGNVYDFTEVNVGPSEAPLFADLQSQTYDPDTVNNVQGTANGDDLQSGTLNDTVYADGGADTVDGGAGSDQLYGEDGSDSLVGGTGNDSLFGGNDNDTLIGGSGSDLINGDNGNDSILGESGDDSIEGGIGNDTIDGGDQGDTIFGGDGNDVIEAGEENTFGDADYIDGGTGNDTITSAEEAADSSDTVFGGSGDDVITMTGGTNLLDGGADDDTITGGQFSDTIYGGTGLDSLDGGSGADLFVVEDGFGADTITGGGGTPSPGQDIDTIDMGSVSSGVTVSATSDQAGTITDGTDTINFSETEALNLTNSADVVDASGDTSGLIIDGREGDDTIDGGSGADTIFGGGGADSLSGGAGDDLIDGRVDQPLILMNFADGASSVAADDSGSGNDGIYQGGASVGGTGWTGQPGDTALVLDGIDDYVEIPNDPSFELDEGTISIRFNADTLHSAALVSRDSAWLDGGGHFRLELNSDGSISFRIQSDSDSYSGTTDSGLITAGDWHQVSATFGTDGFTLYVDGALAASDSYTGGIGGNSEPWTLGADQHASGDGVADNLNDFFDGQIDEFALIPAVLTPAEILDNYSNGVGPSTALGDTIHGDEGNDSILAGSGADSITGDIGADTIEGGDGDDTIDGGADDDVIFGGDGSDFITGGDGNDFLSTGLGNDTLMGGAGNDTLMNSDGDDSLVGGTGNDSIIATGGDDTLEGGDGADTLDGGADNDRLEGGTGNDLLTGGDGSDTFIYTAGDGNDTITDFNFGNTGALGDGDTTNNDFIDLSGYYDNMSELYADQADDGILNQSNTTDTQGRAVDYSDNTQFGDGSLEFQGASADNSSFTADNTGVVCFTKGTAILTPTGEVLIENLRVGDLVVTADNGPKPIRWIGNRTLGKDVLVSKPYLRPVLIRQGVLRNERALLVSPQHGMLIGQQNMVRAKHLAQSMRGVRIANGKRHVTYIHLMFDAHEVIFAERALSESFYPGPTALRMINREAQRELFETFPQLAESVESPSETVSVFGDRARDLARGKAVPDVLANAGF